MVVTTTASPDIIAAAARDNLPVSKFLPPMELVSWKRGCLTCLRRPGGAPLHCRRGRYDQVSALSSALRCIHRDHRIQAREPRFQDARAIVQRFLAGGHFSAASVRFQATHRETRPPVNEATIVAESASHGLRLGAILAPQLGFILNVRERHYRTDLLGNVRIASAWFRGWRSPVRPSAVPRSGSAGRCLPAIGTVRTDRSVRWSAGVRAALVVLRAVRGPSGYRERLRC